MKKLDKTLTLGELSAIKRKKSFSKIYYYTVVFYKTLIEKYFYSVQ